MIKFHEQVPSVYPSASRDFQYLGWLINIVLNSVKHNVDDIYDLPNSKADAKLTELLAMTLGFKIKRNYDQNQLRALVAALPRILKYKGTKAAIDMAGRAILAASGAAGSFDSEIKNGEVTVIFPVTLVDISLFTDLLPYILPAGMTCHVVRKNQVRNTNITKLDYDDDLIASWVTDLDSTDANNNVIPGLATMFNTGSVLPAFSNYYLDNKLNKLNTGLLDNSIIPMIVQTRDVPAIADYTTEPNEFGTTTVINRYTTETNNNDDTTVIIGGDLTE